MCLKKTKKLCAREEGQDFWYPVLDQTTVKDESKSSMKLLVQVSCSLALLWLKIKVAREIVMCGSVLLFKDCGCEIFVVISWEDSWLCFKELFGFWNSHG